MTVKSFDCVLWAAFQSLKPPYRLRAAALFITPDRMIMWGRLNTDNCFSQSLTCCRAENVKLFLRGVKALESVERKGCIPLGSRLYCFLDNEICWVKSWHFTGGLWAPSIQGAATLCALFCWSPLRWHPCGVDRLAPFKSWNSPMQVWMRLRLHPHLMLICLENFMEMRNGNYFNIACANVEF